jgi:hypothetical protein
MATCQECGYKLDLFMVTDEVWAAAGLHPWDISCLACLERRLKRTLTIDDFPACSVNRQAYAAVGKLSVVLEDEWRRWWRRQGKNRRTARLRALRVCRERAGQLLLDLFE